VLVSAVVIFVGKNMPKSEYLKVRLDADELREIERQARALNLPKSRYARLLLTSGKSPPSSPPGGAGVVAYQPSVERIEAQIADMRAELADIRESLTASARAFEELLTFLRESQRIPSFREYRSRAIAENIVNNPGETEQQYLLRLAARYYLLYRRWPTPSDNLQFGPIPQNFDLQKWPMTPPR
jgi:hypothetical protein